ncbi:hypothetical protein PVAND_003982 [Polypedilum vanderplanki]|uniref:Protein-lysine N-methyltransferase SMYD4 n=1 Tax=Polypedilum vanderplanki TaxID=319348 RepID=A0A9J6BW94_POLVA|nr:hypothetical protein PVAND_003982 [Polypedilum vanderplanki]
MDGFKSGFFLNLYQNTRNALKSDELQTFSGLNNNIERMKFVHNVSMIEKKLNLKRHDREQTHRTNNDEIYFYKDLNCALEMKKIGNKFFQNQQWNEALNFYNKSYIMIPSDSQKDVAILFANRSAVLYHLENYDAALKEIERAIACSYPKEMMYKLKERKARCFLAKKDLKEALKAFKEDIQALDDAIIPVDNKLKLERDAQIMIKMIEKNLAIEEKMSSKIKAKEQTNKNDENLNKDNNEERFVSNSLGFDYSEEEGRYAIAAQDIKLGTYLVQEKPHASSLLQNYSQTHCQFCFKRINVPIACSNCADVIYCSENCRDNSWKTFHRFECGIIQHLWSSGASITCQMALRAISQKPLNYFVNLREELIELKSNIDYSKIDTLSNDDYRRIFVLVTHEKERTFEDVFHRMMMANFLLHCLKMCDYFEDDETEENFFYIGSLIYHNLQVMQYNAHEISELQYKGKNDTGSSVFIGGGIYPTVAFFNHSCDPGIVRYYTGNTMMVRAIKHIPKGSIVAENYGPIFTQTPKDERQSQLLKQYHFKCMCVPCMQNWPTFKDMEDTFLRFRCDGKNKTCPSVIQVPLDVNEFMIKCTECGEFTNIMKGLKSVQDTDMLFKTATRLHESGDTKNALSKYLECLQILLQSLVPPFRSFHLTQQGIKRCIMEFGNKVYL